MPDKEPAADDLVRQDSPVQPPSQSNVSQPNGSDVDLEQLIAVAEAKGGPTVDYKASGDPDTDITLPSSDSAPTVSPQAVLAESTAAKPKPCTHIADPSIATCPTCFWPYCASCASALDPKYCHMCLPVPDAELRVEPIVDADGEGHDGRRLVPTGPVYSPPRFMSQLKAFSDMSISEQEDYITHYKELVHQAEIALDYRRIKLGGMQLVNAEAKDAQRRRLRAEKTVRPVKTVTVDAKTGQTKKKTASTADLTKMMQMLQALATLRQKKQADTGAKAAKAPTPTTTATSDKKEETI